jgi:integrase
MATIRKRNGRYQVQIRKDSHPLTTKTFSRLADAKRWAIATEYELAHGLRARPSPGFGTIGDLIDHYLEITDPANINESESYRLKTLNKGLGRVPIDQLKGSDLARYRDLRLKKIKPATLVRELSVLRRVVRIAQSEWDVDINSEPFTRLRIPNQRSARERRLQTGEYERLIAACKSARTPWLLPAVQLAIETGMRRSELLNARHEHVSNGLLLIPKTKTGVARTIPLTSKAQSLIYKLPRSICGRIILLTPNALRLAWGRTTKRAGIEDLHFHDLRHEATSRLFEKGLNPVEVATITGHKDTRMLMRYTHLRAEDLVRRLG